jgi:hypothetical protein
MGGADPGARPRVGRASRGGRRPVWSGDRGQPPPQEVTRPVPARDETSQYVDSAVATHGPLCRDRGVQVVTSVSADAGVQAEAPEDLLRLPGVRLRRRGRLTRALEKVLRVVPMALRPKSWTGGKTSSTTVADWLWLIFGGGVKVLSVGQVELTADKSVSYDMIVTVSHGGSEHVISVHVLSRLLSYVYFRERTPQTVPLLRARAVQYADAVGLPAHLVALVVPGCVRLGMSVSAIESRALGRTGAWWMLLAKILSASRWLLELAWTMVVLALVGGAFVGGGLAAGTVVLAVFWSFRRLYRQGRPGDDQ